MCKNLVISGWIYSSPFDRADFVLGNFLAIRLDLLCLFHLCVHWGDGEWQMCTAWNTAPPLSWRGVCLRFGQLFITAETTVLIDMVIFLYGRTMNGGTCVSQGKWVCIVSPDRTGNGMALPQEIAGFLASFSLYIK